MCAINLAKKRLIFTFIYNYRRCYHCRHFSKGVNTASKKRGRCCNKGKSPSISLTKRAITLPATLIRNPLEMCFTTTSWPFKKKSVKNTSDLHLESKNKNQLTKKPLFLYSLSYSPLIILMQMTVHTHILRVLAVP